MAQDCPTCGSKGTYDPDTQAAADRVNRAQRANLSDDSTYSESSDVPSSATGQGHTLNDNDKYLARHREQSYDVREGKKAIKDRNPGLTDSGVDQVIRTAAKAGSVGSTSSLQQNAQPKPSGFGRVGTSRGVKGQKN